MQKIWELPNTIIAYITWWIKSKKLISEIRYTEDTKIVITNKGISNFAPGKIIFTTEQALEHELTHRKISKYLGWAYLIHIWYLLYSFILLLTSWGGQVAWWNFFGAIAFFFVWFGFNEWLVRWILKKR